VCSLTLQEFCVVDSTVHLVHFVFNGVSCCMKYGTSSHFPLCSFHVTDSIYYVWKMFATLKYQYMSWSRVMWAIQCLFFMAQQPQVGQGLRVIDALRWHSDTPHSLGLDEWSARCRDINLTTHNSHKRQTSMSAAGFKPANLASERPHTRASDCAATGITPVSFMCFKWYPKFY